MKAVKLKDELSAQAQIMRELVSRFPVAEKAAYHETGVAGFVISDRKEGATL